MSLVFGGGGPTFADPVGDFYKTGKWLYDSVELSAPLYKFLFDSAPAAQGSYSINFGLRSQDFNVRALYVDTSKANLMAAWAADSAVLVGPVDATIESVPLKRCFIEPQSSHNTSIEKIISSFDGGVYYMMYAIIRMSAKGGPSS